MNSNHKIILSDQEDPELANHADDVLRKLHLRQRFSYVKINHGLWERLLATEHTANWSESELDAADNGDFFLAGGFRSEIVTLLRNGVSQRPGFIFSASLRAFPNASRLTGWPGDITRIAEYVAKLLPSDLAVNDGLMWKRLALNGRLKELVPALQNRPVCLVGPSHLKQVETYLQISDLHHIEIPLRTARRERKEILEQIAAWARGNAQDPVILFQAGSLSAWLTAHLDQQECDATLLDLGRVLDLSIPRLVEQQDWALLHCKRLNNANSSLGRVEKLRDWDRELAAICGVPDKLYEESTIDSYPKNKVEFLENKTPHFPLVEHLLKPPAQQNHWANYGPVTQLLETAVAHIMKLSSDFCVVACSSGTSAIEGLVAFEEERAGRPLRWVVPAYTFPSSLCACQGDTTVIDVDSTGQFSLERLKELPIESYDAVLATNLFGRMTQLDALSEFCRTHNKALVLDNATGLNAPLQRSMQSPNEAISLHQTKVWGMGEGGLVVCKREQEQSFRALLSPGLRSTVNPQRRRNAKLSDFSAALILARLLYRPRWERAYNWQTWRIEEAAHAVGFGTFGSRFNSVGSVITLPFAALLAPKPLSLKELNDCASVKLQKYYRPLKSFEVADDLFARMLAVPSHFGMAALSRQDIQNLLSELIGE